jgi:phage shock protein A
MFNRLRKTLDEALRKLEDAFGAGPEDEIDDLLRAMRSELIETKARIPEIEGQIRLFRNKVAAERQKVEECVRRASQAEAIGDEETADVARSFEAKHRSRAEVAEQKLEAAEAELALQRQTVVEQTSQLKSAMARRDAIAAQARRSRATDRLRGGGESAVDDFERLEESLERDADLHSAAREVDEALGDYTAADERFEVPLDPAVLADEQLRELKRRMAEEEKKKRGE